MIYIMCMSFYFRVSILAFSSYILSNRFIVHCFYNMSQRLFACVFSACNIRRPDVLFDLSCGKKENEKTCECRSTIRRLENRRALEKQYSRSSMFHKDRKMDN